MIQYKKELQGLVSRGGGGGVLLLLLLGRTFFSVVLRRSELLRTTVVLLWASERQQAFDSVASFLRSNRALAAPLLGKHTLNPQGGRLPVGSRGLFFARRVTVSLIWAPQHFVGLYVGGVRLVVYMDDHDLTFF